MEENWCIRSFTGSAMKGRQSFLFLMIWMKSWMTRMRLWTGIHFLKRRAWILFVNRLNIYWSWRKHCLRKIRSLTQCWKWSRRRAGMKRKTKSWSSAASSIRWDISIKGLQKKDSGLALFMAAFRMMSEGSFGNGLIPRRPRPMIRMRWISCSSRRLAVKAWIISSVTAWSIMTCRGTPWK